MSVPLVLVPGLMCDARVFMPQIVELNKNHPIQIASVAGADTIEGMARTALAGAPETFALVGHAMGGNVAMEMLRQAPERVARIALISTSAAVETPQAAAAREPQIVRAKAGKLQEVIGEIFHSGAFFDGPALAQVLRLMREMANRLGADAFSRQSHALQRRPDQQRMLRTSQTPALVIGGAADQLVPPARSEFIAGMMKNAELRVIENAGHLPMVEAADAVTDALKVWLGGPLILR